MVIRHAPFLSIRYNALYYWKNSKNSLTNGGIHLPTYKIFLFNQSLISFVHMSYWPSRMTAMCQQNVTHDVEALIQHDGLAMTAHIISLHLAKIVGSHPATN
jgi:hypothetical protein